MRSVLLGQSGQDQRTQYIFIKYTESDYWPGVCKQANLSSGQRYVGPFPLFQAPLCSIFFLDWRTANWCRSHRKSEEGKKTAIEELEAGTEKANRRGLCWILSASTVKKINCDWVKHRPLSYMKHWLIHNSANKQRPSVRRVLDVL